MVRRPGFFIAICLLICSIAVEVDGQTPPVHITALPQILNTNSLIDQPEEFRALQEKVEKELSTSISGLHLPVLNQRMAAIRDSLIKPFDRVKVSFDTNNNLRISAFSSLFVFDLRSIHGPNSLLDTLKKNFKARIKPPITTLVNSFDPKTRVLLSALLRALEMKGSLIDEIPGIISVSDIVAPLKNDSITKADSLAEILAEKISGELASLLRDRLEEIVDGIVRDPKIAFGEMKWKDFAYAVTGDTSAPEGEGHKWIAQFLNDKLNEARQALARLLDAGEYEISKVIGGAHKFLVDASLGVSLNPGENGSAGTFGVTWRPLKTFQMGVVIAGLVGSSSEDSSHALVGGQIRVTPSLCGWKPELAAVGSKYLGGDAWELGAGFSFRTVGFLGSGKLGWTLGGYCLFRGETHVVRLEDNPLSEMTATFTASLRLIDLSAASVTFGLACNDGWDSRKIFVQASLPAYPKF